MGMEEEVVVVAVASGKVKCSEVNWSDGRNKEKEQCYWFFFFFFCFVLFSSHKCITGNEDNETKPTTTSKKPNHSLTHSLVYDFIKTVSFFSTQTRSMNKFCFTSFSFRVHILYCATLCYDGSVFCFVFSATTMPLFSLSETEREES